MRNSMWLHKPCLEAAGARDLHLTLKEVLKLLPRSRLLRKPQKQQWARNMWKEYGENTSMHAMDLWSTLSFSWETVMITDDTSKHRSGFRASQRTKGTSQRTKNKIIDKQAIDCNYSHSSFPSICVSVLSPHPTPTWCWGKGGNWDLLSHQN